MAKITYEDKVKLQDEPDIPNKNKVTDNDMNEIKDVVNTNADELDTAKENIENLEEGQGTNSTDITNLKGRMTTLETDNAKNKSDISNLQKDNETNKTNISNLRNSKVDKIEGKGLSTEDFTTALKTKLEGLENYNDTEIKNRIQILEDDNASNKMDITNLQEDVNNLGEEIETNKTDIETLQAENKNLKEEVESYKNSLPRETQEGEYITMQNTADKVKFKDFVLGGNSKQESRSGKNKLNIEDLTGNYVIDKEAETGTFTVQNSWANTIMTNENLIKSLKANTAYKCIAKVTLLEKPENAQASLHNGIIALLHTDNSNTTNVLATSTITEKDNWTVNTSKTLETNFTTMEDLTGVKLIAYNYLDAENNHAGKFKIENAIILEATEENETFEQYGASPSPEFPAKIENVEGDVEVTVANKNIANAEQLYQDMLNFNPNVRKKVVDGRNCILFSNMLFMYSKGFRGLQGIYKKNTRYVIRAMCRVQDTSIVDAKSLMIDSHDEKGNLTGYFTSTAKGKNWIQFSFLTNAGASVDCISFSYGNNTMWYLDMDSLEIYEATKVEDFVANKQQTVTFPLEEGQKLYKGDYLADDGIHHIRKQIELDGTETIHQGADLGSVLRFLCSAVITENSYKNRINQICSHFIFNYNFTSDEEHFYIEDNSGNIYIFISKERLPDVSIEGFKTWLAEQKTNGTPVILECELAEEEIEAYTEEQQEAYNKLKELTTYATQTNIYSTNNPSPVFKVTGIKDVNSMLTQVNQLILEEGGN